MAAAARGLHLSDQIGVLLETLELSGDRYAMKSALHQFSRAAGLRRFAYVGVSSEAVRTFTDLPEEWENRYHGEQFAAVDPVVAHAKRTLKPFSWSFSTMEIPDHAAQHYCGEIGQVGVASGMTIPMKVGPGRTAMLTFMTDGRSRPQVSTSALEEAVAAVAYTHLYVSKMDSATLRGPGHSLTPTELACVIWVSLGKTEFEIARMCGLSERAVHSHLENSRAKLSAANTPHMVRLALESRIMPLR